MDSQEIILQMKMFVRSEQSELIKSCLFYWYCLSITQIKAETSLIGHMNKIWLIFFIFI